MMSNLDLAVDVVDAMSFRFTGGGIGTIAASGSIRPGQDSQQELRYYGTEGYALQDLLAGTLSIHRNDGTVERLDPPLAEEEIYPAARPARAFADLIADPAADNLSPAGPAADTVAFLEAAYTSASRDGAPVTVASPAP
jgi:hypothetical protein